MKRTVTLGFLTLLASAALAQAPFTIVRPADGAKVRETVHIEVPRTSVQSGYIGVYINGKFVEAISPKFMSPKDKYISYDLDTKKMALPDGPAKVELALFVDYNGGTKIVDRTSVTLNIANESSIKVPLNGYLLKYKFTKGTESDYDVTEKVSFRQITNAESRLGGRANEVTNRLEKFRFKYAIDNSYPNGDGLVRMQMEPEKGKDYAFLTIAELGAKARKYTDEQFAPTYMRMKDNGRQVFGSVPLTTGFTDDGSISKLNIFATIPLPTLPNKPVRPGDTFSTNFQIGDLDYDNLENLNSLVRIVPSRGEFLRVEWEDGHPCAVLKNTLQAHIEDEPMSEIVDTVWFALDKKIIIKRVQSFNIDVSDFPLATPIDEINRQNQRRRGRRGPDEGQRGQSQGGGSAPETTFMTPAQRSGGAANSNASPNAAPQPVNTGTRGGQVPGRAGGGPGRTGAAPADPGSKKLVNFELTFKLQH